MISSSTKRYNLESKEPPQNNREPVEVPEKEEVTVEDPVDKPEHRPCSELASLGKTNVTEKSM